MPFNNSALREHSQSPAPSVDGKPRFSIGHISIGAADVDLLTRFYEQIGMRLVVEMGRASILELRGGTHLIVNQGRSGEGSLDLIVQDIDDTHAVLAAAGANPGSITRGHPHDRFNATDPEGNVLVVASDHSIGLV